MQRGWINAIAVISLLQFVSNLSLAQEGSPTTPTLQRNSGDERTACPSSDFSKFSELYSNNIPIQQRYTSFPLTYRYTYVGPQGTTKRTRAIDSFDSYLRIFQTKSIYPDNAEIRRWQLGSKLIDFAAAARQS
jgi:hypothetical protein